MTTTVDIVAVRAELQAISDRAIELESLHADSLDAVHPEYRDGARNLLHYLALRETDIRALQENLAILGLSSLGRAERNVMASIRAVQSALDRTPADPGELVLRNPRAELHKRALLGNTPDDRDVSIMVTLPTEAGENFELVEEMVAAGMNVARINCAHDDDTVWTTMIDNVRRASIEAGKSCRIIMDLAGPKIRTGELQVGPKVFHAKTRRDPTGRTVAPRRIRLIPDDVLWLGTKVAVVPVPPQCIDEAGVGDELRFKDTRGKKRSLRVVQKDPKGIVVETWKGAYIATGTKLRLRPSPTGEKRSYIVGELAPVEQPVLLQSGDTLILNGSNIPGAPAVMDSEGDVVEAAHISCRQPEVFEFVEENHRVSLNDGKIGGIVRSKHDDYLEIEITKAKPTGSRLRGDKGINFPDSDITLPGLTSLDRDNLEFVAKHADAVSLSFVKRPSDIVSLQNAVVEQGDRGLGIIVKIETKKGFRNLPRLLFTAMRSYPVGAMIARGDLAVECGWEVLAEMQEEILWMCEAAQIPVIWATQVLESSTKTGLPSRAEISDAAMSQRADCVMLNKGPHILATIRTLDNILRRMQSHQYKKTPRLRKLKIAKMGDDD